MPDSTPPPPRRALILAAGLGTRLRPLTWKTPKPLMTVWGEPLLDHAIRLLGSFGVTEFAINLHWRSEALLGHLARRWPAIDFRLSREEQILGTGGALLPLRDFLETEETFWVFNADVLASFDGAALLQQHRRSKALATLWLTDHSGPRTVELTADGTIATFRSQRAASPGTWTFTGIHLLSGDIYRYLSSRTPSGIVEAYERALAAGERIAGGTLPDTWWADGGTPTAILQIHREIRQRHQQNLPGGQYYNPALDQHGSACVAPTAICAPNVELDDCVIGPDARIAAGVRLRHCIVGSAVSVAHHAASAVLARPSDFEDPRVSAALQTLGWSDDHTTAEALAARGSDRAFFRLSTIGTRAILAVHGEERPENARYADLAEALQRADIPVPTILARSTAQRWLVMEDLGDDDLGGRVRTLPQSEWRSLYGRVLETVIRLHRDGADAIGGLETEPAFDADVYRWERELFAEHLLRRRQGLDSATISDIVAELETISPPLEQARSVLLHRDLQSSNIFFHCGRPCLIDFQGLRPGPPAYDLGSLLCDPYVQLPRRLRHQLLDDYAAQVEWGAETKRLFSYAAAQRLTQALGAYARLAAFPGTERFADHIAPAAAILLEESEELPGLTQLRKLLQKLAQL